MIVRPAIVSKNGVFDVAIFNANVMLPWADLKKLLHLTNVHFITFTRYLTCSSMWKFDYMMFEIREFNFVKLLQLKNNFFRRITQTCNTLFRWTIRGVSNISICHIIECSMIADYYIIVNIIKISLRIVLTLQWVCLFSLLCIQLTISNVYLSTIIVKKLELYNSPNYVNFLERTWKKFFSCLNLLKKILQSPFKLNILNKKKLMSGKFIKNVN